MAKRTRQRTPNPKIAGSTPAEGKLLKKLDDDEYRTPSGRYSVIRNRGMTGRWERNKNGWLVYKGKTYLAWASSISKAEQLLKALGAE